MVVGFFYCWVERTVLYKKMVLWRTLHKSCKCSWILGNFFLESVSFYLEMFDVNNFRLVLVVCNVHVVNLYQKISVIYVRDQFL